MCACTRRSWGHLSDIRRSRWSSSTGRRAGAGAEERPWPAAAAPANSPFSPSRFSPPPWRSAWLWAFAAAWPSFQESCHSGPEQRDRSLLNVNRCKSWNSGSLFACFITAVLCSLHFTAKMSKMQQLTCAQKMLRTRRKPKNSFIMDREFKQLVVSNKRSIGLLFIQMGNQSHLLLHQSVH